MLQIVDILSSPLHVVTDSLKVGDGDETTTLIYHTQFSDSLYLLLAPFTGPFLFLPDSFFVFIYLVLLPKTTFYSCAFLFHSSALSRRPSRGN